jgi:hypothetical protein
MGEPDPSNYAELRDEAERQRLKLIKAELESALTFAGLARTEYSLGEFAGAEQAITNARRAYRVVLKYLPKAQPTEQEKQTIEDKLKELKLALDQLPKLRKMQ